MPSGQIIRKRDLDLRIRIGDHDNAAAPTVKATSNSVDESH